MKEELYICKHYMVPYKFSCWNMLEDCTHTQTHTIKNTVSAITPKHSSSSSSAPTPLFPGFILNSKQPFLFFQLAQKTNFSQRRQGDFEALNSLFLGLS